MRANILGFDASRDVAVLRVPGYRPSSIAKLGKPVTKGDALTLVDDLGDDQPIVGARRGDKRRDPRWMVAVVALSALLIGGGAVTVLLVSLHPTRNSVQLLANSLAEPKDALLAAERANDAGQASLAAAAGSTGAQRTALLTASIDHAQEASTEWDRYHSTAVGLPGEQELADRYVVRAALAIANGQPVPQAVTDAFPRLPEVMARADALSGRIDRAVIDLAEAAVLNGHVGETFDAIVTDLDERGADQDQAQPARGRCGRRRNSAKDPGSGSRASQVIASRRG